MPTAFDMLPDRFEQLGDDRAILMRLGLKRAGFEVKKCAGFCDPRDERDVLITWTAHKGAKEQARDRFEAAGGQVIVAEEAHIRFVPNGPYPGEQYFSLCLHDHQDQWATGGPERWASWNIELQPWRTEGAKVLVREQRGIGSSHAASPPHWHTDMAARLRRFTDRLIEIVEHPKKLKQRGQPVPTVEQQFADAWCVVTWNSHMGTEALIHGIPVIACGPKFFLKDIANGPTSFVDEPPLFGPGARATAFEEFAWAQWSRSEIASGEAFSRLLA